MRTLAWFRSGLPAVLTVLATFVTLAGGSSLGAQSAFLLQEIGDEVGVEQIESFGHIAISNSGEWVAIVDTDSTAEEEDDGFVLRNGFVTLQEGVVLGKPANARIDEFRSLSLDGQGNLAWEFLLEDPNILNVENEGVYWNTKLAFLRGDPLNTPGYGRSAVWFRFNGFVKHNSAGQILVASEVDDPTIGGFSDQSLILVTTDGDATVVSSVDIAHENGNLPGSSLTIPQDGLTLNNPLLIDLNERGDVLWQTRIANVPAANDRAILLNQNIVVQEGDVAPVTGRRWASLQNVRLDLNDRGEFVHEGSLDAPQQNQRALIAKGNVAVMRERQQIPALGTGLVNDFGLATPILLSNAGDVFYRVTLTGSTLTDAAFLVGQEVLVQKGISTVEGQQITEFVDGPDSLAISPSGRYVMYKVTLGSGNNALCLLDIGRVEAIDDCGSTAGTLVRRSGFAVPGGRITLAADGGQAIGVTPVLLVSDSTVPGYPPCGLDTAFGELIVDLSPPNPLIGKIGTPWGGAPVPFGLDVANALSLVGAKLYAQAFFVDFPGAAPAGVPRIQATQAVEIEIGSP